MLKWLLDLLKALFGGKPKAALPEHVDPDKTPVEPIADKLEPRDTQDDPDLPKDLEGEGAEDYRADFEAQPERAEVSEEQKASLVLKLGDSGPKVKEFQGWLERLGYELTRFGADGSFGDETLQETCDFQDDDREKGGKLKDEEHAIRLGGVGPKTYEAIKTAFEALPKVAPPPRIEPEPPADISTRTPKNFYRLCPVNGKGVKAKRLRKNNWKGIVGITLHQTAVNMGNRASRYKKVSAHVAITPDGKIVQMNGLNWVVYHGHSFNGSRGPGDVGIEISGAFAGIEGDESTFWRPKSKPYRKPDSVTDAQIEATLRCIEWTINEVKEHGGEVKFIHAHRQSSKMRTSDPGSKVWETIALVSKERWGLRDGGPKFTAGGYAIPKQWDPSYTSNYRPWRG